MEFLLLQQTTADTLDAMLYDIASAHVPNSSTRKYAGHITNSDTGEEALKLPSGQTFLLSEQADIDQFASQVETWLGSTAKQEVLDGYSTNKGQKVVLKNFLPSAVQDQIYTRDELENMDSGWANDTQL